MRGPTTVDIHAVTALFVSLAVFACLIAAATATTENDGQAWQTPGCQIVAHRRKVKIPGCVVFEVITNACVGYCESYAIPSPYRTLRTNKRHVFTSRADCCNIIDTHDVKVTTRCQDT